ncbi:MAG TPA: PHB depolymerase family esterase [Polyangiaceae bacterium]|nr:PHB depolymerase family esterase [Polyangiaceae bacterium]
MRVIEALVSAGWLAVRAVLLCALCACDRGASPSARTRPAAAHGTGNGLSSSPTLSALPAASQVTDIPATGSAELVVPAAQLYEPGDLSPGERRPLLIFLHGLGASGKLAFDSLQLATLGARERVFVLAPDGSLDGQKRRFWNAGPACCNFDRRDVDDVGRLTRLIEAWRSRANVDSNRVYVVGHSNGGFMTHRLACALGDRIAAAASLAGAAPASDQACTGAKTLALLEVHGDADPIVRYEGGRVFDSPELAPFPSAEQGFQAWGKRLGCTGAAVAGPARDLDSRLPGAETSVERYANCASGSVELWTVHGGNHFVATEPRTFEAIWQFLAAHHAHHG